MFSVAVKGYGIVIWDDDGAWRIFGANESLSATLSARVELALAAIPGYDNEHDIRDALLSMSGAGLLSADCEHGPGECDGDTNPADGAIH